MKDLGQLALAMGANVGLMLPKLRPLHAVKLMRVSVPGVGIRNGEGTYLLLMTTAVARIGQAVATFPLTAMAARVATAAAVVVVLIAAARAVEGRQHVVYQRTVSSLTIFIYANNGYRQTVVYVVLKTHSKVQIIPSVAK